MAILSSKSWPCTGSKYRIEFPVPDSCERVGRETLLLVEAGELDPCIFFLMTPPNDTCDNNNNSEDNIDSLIGGSFLLVRERDCFRTEVEW